MSQTMQAVRMHEHVGIDGLRVEEVARPAPGVGEVLIEMKAAGVNPVDWKIAEGFSKEAFNHTLPMALGCEVSGVIAEVGEGVEGFATGDAVFGYLSLMRFGAYAHYVIALPDEIAAKPGDLSHEEAAAIPVGALTSAQALFDTAGLGAGQTVLIHAAAGGVGSAAVQLAKARGATVIGTASGANEAFVRSLGADEFIDYRTTAFEEAVRDVDVVYDTIGGDTQARSFGVLKPGGFLVSILTPPSAELAERHGVKAATLMVAPNGRQLAEIAPHVKPTIAQTFPLAETHAALKQSRSGRTRGKLIVLPG